MMHQCVLKVGGESSFSINCDAFAIKSVLTLLSRMLPAHSNRSDIITQPL